MLDKLCLPPTIRICYNTAMSRLMQRHQKFVKVLSASSLLQTHVCELVILQFCIASVDCMPCHPLDARFESVSCNEGQQRQPQVLLWTESRPEKSDVIVHCSKVGHTCSAESPMRAPTPSSLTTKLLPGKQALSGWQHTVSLLRAEVTCATGMQAVIAHVIRTHVRRKSIAA